MIRGIMGSASAAFVAIALSASGAQAGTGTYTISGAADLSFDGTDYTDEAFAFTLITHTVVNVTDQYGDQYQEIDPVASATVGVGAIGTFTLLDSTGLDAEPNASINFFQNSSPGQDIFAWLAASPVNLDHGFSAVGSNEYAPGSYVTEVYGAVIPTSGGDLQFRLVGPPGPDLTFAGTVIGVVPEPRAWTLMLLGFGSVGALARARRRPVAA